MRTGLLLTMLLLGGCTDPVITLADMGRDLVLVFPAGCADGVMDGDEADVDCGGPACAKCEAGKMCLHGSDCDGTICDNNRCAAPSCTDKLRNGGETDVDCGGPCPGCAIGNMCLMPGDCASGNCVNNTCQTGPCMNGMKDGMETDVDCGGPVCDACADGKMCLLVSDCRGMRCVNNICQSAINCTAPMANCDGNPQSGCNINLSMDPKNCGKCGSVCPMNAPNCAAGKCISGCANGIKPPSPCFSGVDAHGNWPWVVCRADCNSAWLTNANLKDNFYHPTEICQSLGYKSVKSWGGLSNRVCGYGGVDFGPTSCAMPGTETYDGCCRQPDDQFGMVLRGAMAWLCVDK